ncbi:MAG: AAA family ATPase, partial [Acidobacteriota bacterium]|nr:AAA family ATPase [Acidobacteriota bacterium]
MSNNVAIEVVKAETHNLKAVDCRIPHGRVTVVTGPSGAGKSSLAFDTVFAEGQRRFVESMSTYARQFLEQMERPPVGEIRNILPAVALETKNSVKNARSTVGTISEVLDVLRLLFSHLGEVRCPEHDEVARMFTTEEIVTELEAGAAGENFFLIAPVERPPKLADEAIRTLISQGFSRRLEDGEVVRMSSKARWLKRLDPLPLVLGRFRSGAPSSRLASTIEDALTLGHGRLEVRGETGTRHFSRGLGCTSCGRLFRRPQPALFSFNSPLGACQSCQGFGRMIGIDRNRVIPNPELSLDTLPIAPWNTPAYEEHYERLFDACEDRGVPIDVPWEELPQADRDWIWRGEGEGEADFVNLERFFAWLERRSYKVHVRVMLARYRSYDACPGCDGTRLQPEALRVRLQGMTLPELCTLSVEDLRQWLGSQQWSPRQIEVAEHLIEEVVERVDILYRVGLDYLTLDRQARTLSGGEAQRIQLAAAIGSRLTSTLYVLDEPTIGLHPKDSHRLLDLLHSLSDRGNTVLVVEHDRTLIAGADHVIDLGPLAGEHGGRLMVEGPLSEILECDESLTAVYMRDRPPTAARRHGARFRRERGRETLTKELEGRQRFSVR